MSLPLLDTPTYELTLPSTEEKIKFRPFLVKEHKILMTLADAETSEVVRVVKELIDTCTFGKLKVNKLSNFDIEYIFLNLRAKSIGEVVKVVVNCPCGNDIDHQIDLNQVRIERSEGFQKKFKIRENISVEMRYPTFEEMMDILQNLNNAKVFSVVSKCINAIYTDQDFYDRNQFTDEEADDFLSQLTKTEFEQIEKFFLTMPKIVQDVEADCDKCGTHNVVKMEGIENFFV